MTEEVLFTAFTASAVARVLSLHISIIKNRLKLLKVSTITGFAVSEQADLMQSIEPKHICRSVMDLTI